LSETLVRDVVRDVRDVVRDVRSNLSKALAIAVVRDVRR